MAFNVLLTGYLFDGNFDLFFEILDILAQKGLHLIYAFQYLNWCFMYMPHTFMNLQDKN